MVPYLLGFLFFSIVSAEQDSYVVTKYDTVVGESLLGGKYEQLNTLNLGDDDVTRLSLPWQFPFFSDKYSYGYLSSNGVLSFSNEFVPVGISSSQNEKEDDVHIADVTSRIYNVVLHRHTLSKHTYSLAENIRKNHNNRGWRGFSGYIHKIFPRLRMLTVKDPSPDALHYLRSNEHVLSVHEERKLTVEDRSYLRSKRKLTSDPYSWGLDRIDQDDLPLDEATYTPPLETKKGANVDVYVLDTGIATTHVEFESLPGYEREVKNVWDGYISDVTSPDADNDAHGHGSHCAGTIGGVNVGVAPAANIYGMKVLSDSGSGSTSTIIDALEYVMEQRKANTTRGIVVSMSLGGSCSADCENDAIVIAVNELSRYSITTVVAAGNDATDACTKTPAAAQTAITVGSTTSLDAMSSFSNYDVCVDVFAPGSSIRSVCSTCSSRSSYTLLSGTSMACPHVAGTVALWLAMTSSEYIMDPPSAGQLATAVQCTGAWNKLSSLAGNSYDILLQVPPKVSSLTESYDSCDLLSNNCAIGSGGAICSGHGICFDDGACRCDTFYDGNDCSEYLNNCSPECGDHGRCVFGWCDCESGWFGTQCTMPCVVDGIECSGHGMCSNTGCACDVEWGGDRCDITCETVDGEVCSGQGVCRGGSCLCDSKYTGTNCEEDYFDYLSDSYCCVGSTLDATHDPPFDAIAFFWTDLNPSSSSSGNVYAGSTDDNTFAVVFDGIVPYGASYTSCLLTLELILYDTGNFDIALVSNRIAHDPSCSQHMISMGIKSAYQNGKLQYEQTEGPAYYGLPQSALYSYRRILTIPPSSFPTIFPTVSSKPTIEVTSSCFHGIDDEMIDLVSGEPLTSTWVEIGFVTVDDQAWVSVVTSLSTFSDASVFISLPDVPGDTSSEGYPVIPRVRNVEVSSGHVSFEARLYQANDSLCSKEWHIPEPVSPAPLLTWLVAEHGAYDLSGRHIFVGSGPITRQSADPSNRDNFVRINYPSGCGSSTTLCSFAEDVDIGVILQLQTVVYDRLLIPRGFNIARRFGKYVIQPHDSVDESYYVMLLPETLSYMAFEAGISVSCAEGWTFETHTYSGVTDSLLHIDFINEYISPPGVFGIVGTSTSLVDSTGLRVFSVTTTGANMITQEDQCVDEETIHTTGESVLVFVIGEGAASSDCILCKGILSDSVTGAPSPSPSTSSPSVSHSPTSFPTHTSTPNPTNAPTFQPTHFPTVPPTLSPTVAGTDACDGGVDDEMIDLVSGEPLTSTWVEIGFVTVDDQAWVSVVTSLFTFSDASVFISLPDVPGDTSSEGYPVIPRVRNMEVSSGHVSFEARLYQANDSLCSKEWHIPEPVSPAPLLTWLVAEHGAYDLSGRHIFVGSGPITRQSADPSNRDNFVRINYPSGCGSSTTLCSFAEDVDIGVILQLQTVVYDRLLIPRGFNIARRFGKYVIQPHDSVDESYYVMLLPETLSYMAFEAGISVSCAEGWTFETHTYSGVTDSLLHIDFINEYISPPGVFGIVGTSTSLVDSTGLRVFSVTTTGANMITQEDQCVDEETIHTTGESVLVFVIGEGAASSDCILCKGILSDSVTGAPSPSPSTSSPSVSHSPTSFPTHTSTPNPTNAPTLQPTHFPTVPPTLSPTVAGTDACDGGVDDEMIDLVSGEPLTSTWVEIGFVTVDDQAWVSVVTSLFTFSDASVFISLPDVPGDTSSEGYPVIPRVRNMEVSSGHVSFEARLYQANDSLCSKEWHIPEPVSPAPLLTWLVAEHGAYDLSGRHIFVGSGPITRQSADPSNRDNFVRINYPSGCGSSTTLCSFAEDVDIGVILQLQTVVYDRLLIPRGFNIARRFGKYVIQPHDSVDESYYVMLLPETLSYMAFEAGISVSCAEGWTFETHTYSGVTDSLLHIDFINEYISPPGVFGIVGTSTSLVDSTGLRVFSVTTTGANMITQEDQCVDEETIHTTGESVLVFVIGEGAASSDCILCKGILSDSVTGAPSPSPSTSSPSVSHSPTSFPTHTSTPNPTNAPTLQPTHFPTVPPTLSPTVAGTDACDGGVDDEMIDLVSGEPLTSTWVEIGFVTVDDQAWVSVVTSLFTFSDASVFISLPDVPGDTSSEGYPVIPRVRNMEVSSGHVSFEARLYQANDSLCSKEWHIPEPVSPAPLLTWLVAEHGAYDLSGRHIFVGSGPITRQSADPSNRDNFVRINYPSGCGSSTTLCSFAEDVDIGVILQLQTVVYDRLLIPRGFNIARRFGKYVIQPHDSVDESYYVMLLPETLSYMAFEAGISVSCAEGWTFETHTYSGVTDSLLHIDFINEYISPPGVFGIVGTSTSLVDSTGLRVFSVTTTGANMITQEDQCVDEETIHTTGRVCWCS